MQFEGAFHTRRSFSLALAALIVLTQAVGLYTLTEFRGMHDRARENLRAPTITWLDFASPRATAGSQAPVRDVFVPAQKQSGPFVAPPFDFPAPSPAALQNPAGVGALRDLDCTALYGDKIPPNERERCAEIRRKLAGASQPLTMDEELLRKFDHDKAIAESPILLPCFGGGGISLMCMAGHVANGFDFKMGTYAEDPTHATRNRPHRGVTGLPDTNHGMRR